MYIKGIDIRNRLGFQAGRMPEVDPTHDASVNLQFSIVSTVGMAGGINLLDGKIAAPNSSPTSRIHGVIGPVTGFPTNCNLKITGGLPSSAPYDPMTCAAIFTRTSSPTTPAYIYSTIASTGNGLLSGTTAGVTNPLFGWAGGTTTTVTSAMSFLTNASYFFAISVYKGALGTAIGNYVIVNLDNGARFSGTFTPTKGATAQDTDVYIGNRGLNSRQGLCDVAAAMQSNTFLTLPQLLRWADDPWSFWYQNKIDHLVGVSTPSTNKPFFINFPMGGM